MDAIARALALKGLNGLGATGFISQLPNAKLIPIHLPNALNGENDLYTVPAGRRALIWRLGATNPTAGAINLTPQLKNSGNYYNFRDAISIGGNGVFSSTAPAFVFEPGDTLSMNASAVNLTMRGALVEFDNSAPLKTARLLAIASGDNLLYQPAAGKAGLVMPSSLSFPTGAGAIGVYNNTGSSITWTPYHLPTPGTADSTTYQSIVGQVLAAGSAGAGATPCGLMMIGSGEALRVNSTVAGAGMMWATVTEYAA